MLDALPHQVQAELHAGQRGFQLVAGDAHKGIHRLARLAQRQHACRATHRSDLITERRRRAQVLILSTDRAFKVTVHGQLDSRC